MFIIKLLLSLGAHTLPGDDSSNGQPLGLWLRFSGAGELLDIVSLVIIKLVITSLKLKYWSSLHQGGRGYYSYPRRAL